MIMSAVGFVDRKNRVSNLPFFSTIYGRFLTEDDSYCRILSLTLDIIGLGIKIKFYTLLYNIVLSNSTIALLFTYP